MSWAQEVIERGEKRKQHVIEIVTRDGKELRFPLPFGGPARAAFRRQREDFISRQTKQPNPIWVQSGLMPAGGYPELELGVVFDLSYLCEEKLSHEDVLKMLQVNEVEVMAVYGALNRKVEVYFKEEKDLEIIEKKASLTSEENGTGSIEPASEPSVSLLVS